MCGLKLRTNPSRLKSLAKFCGPSALRGSTLRTKLSESRSVIGECGRIAMSALARGYAALLTNALVAGQVFAIFGLRRKAELDFLLGGRRPIALSTLRRERGQIDVSAQPQDAGADRIAGQIEDVRVVATFDAEPRVDDERQRAEAEPRALAVDRGRVRAPRTGLRARDGSREQEAHHQRQRKFGHASLVRAREGRTLEVGGAWGSREGSSAVPYQSRVVSTVVSLGGSTLTSRRSAAEVASAHARASSE